MTPTQEIAHVNAQDAINRGCGCAILALVLGAIVILIIGYWATH